MQPARVVTYSQLAAASHASGTSIALTTIGAGLLALAFVLGVGTAARNGRLKDYPRWRRPFGVTAAVAGVIGLVLLIVGLTLR